MDTAVRIVQSVLGLGLAALNVERRHGVTITVGGRPWYRRRG